MRETPTEHRGRNVIAGSRVRRIDQPVLIDCGGAATSGDSMTVIPLLEGDRVAGIEVRCRCGAGIVVEHVVEEEAKG